jgi:hypothetical protein
MRKVLDVRNSGLAAAGVTAIAAAFELVRVIVTGGAGRGQTAAGVLSEAIVFALVLGLAAVGLALHRQIGWIAGVGAIVVALSYGVVLRAAGDPIGIAYMVLAIVLFPLIVKSLPYYRTELPA